MSLYLLHYGYFQLACFRASNLPTGKQFKIIKMVIKKKVRGEGGGMREGGGMVGRFMRARVPNGPCHDIDNLCSTKSHVWPPERQDKCVCCLHKSLST